MPLFYVDIEKRLNSEFWSNRYIIRSPSFAEAIEAGEDFVNIERVFHAQQVTFNRVRTSTAVSDDETYHIATLGVNGLRDPGTSLLPLFNTLRVDFTALSGRPSRKFYRGVLSEGDINGDAIVTDFDMTARWGNQLALPEGPAGIVDPQDTLLVAVVQHPFVQMRQLRRGTRRRANGGGIFQ